MRQRVTAWALLLVLTTAPLFSACSSRRPVSLDASRPDTVAFKGMTRVTMMDSSIVYLEVATLTRDSIRGNQRVGPESAGYRATAIPLAAVQSIESDRFDLGKTVLIVAGAYLAVVVAVVFVLAGLNPACPTLQAC